jgi:hypothetical protein
MKPAFKFGRPQRRVCQVLSCLCAAVLMGCEAETVELSPSLHTRIVDGLTGKPLDHVRVMLLSRDAPVSETAYSDLNGIVDMPGLKGQLAFQLFADTSPSTVHAVFDRPGYQRYTLDSVNGYGFFRGYRDVRLYP